MSHFHLALLLGMTVALGPLALDAYLPAFPSIAEGLGIAHSEVGLTLSACVATLGLAQLVGSPLSDRYGRRPVLLAGLAIFAAAALMISLANTLTDLVIWRIVQGIGGGISALSSLYGGHALLPISATMLLCSAGAVVLALGAPQAVAREITAAPSRDSAQAN